MREKFFEKIDYSHVLRNENKRADELSNIAVNNYSQNNIINDDNDSDTIC